LIAYINPQSSKPQPKNNDDIIPIYDSDSSNSESGDAQAQSSRNLGGERPPTKRLKVDRKKNRNLAMTEELIDLIYDYSIFTTLNAYLINDSGLHRTIISRDILLIYSLLHLKNGSTLQMHCFIHHCIS
jgi:hypothetical protein